jgi:hypothetical protein
MDWGYCGSSPSAPCSSAAQVLGSLALTFLAVIAFLFAVFMVVRLVYLAFHFEDGGYKRDNHIAAIARAQTGAMAWEKQDTTDTTTYIRQLYDNLEAEKERRRIEAERMMYRPAPPLPHKD